ncbi:MAG: CinA family protein [Verrucomicrobiota bacterium]|nr:CinA family protein [Verrucomicrobiota bacterium]
MANRRTRRSLEAAIGRRLTRQGLTLAVAESCTGGLIGQRITSVSGSSAYFRGGIVAYANDLKRKLLGVPAALLQAQGAVSRAVAAAMAAGVRTRCGADVSLAITGIAGPGGGAPGKPVGLVYVGVAAARRGTTRGFRFGGSRARVRRLGGEAALKLLNEFLKRRKGDRYE